MTPMEEKLDARLRDIAVLLHSMDKTLVKQEANLSEHMRRTEALELMLAQARKDTEKSLTRTRHELLTKIAPLKTHVDRWKFSFQLLGILAVIASLTWTCLQIYERTVKTAAPASKPASLEQKDAQVPALRSARPQK